jgi:hypothetical protein
MPGPRKRRLTRTDGAVVGIFVPIDEEDVHDLVEATLEVEDEDDGFDDDDLDDEYED